MTAQHTPGPWAVGPAFDNDGEPEIIIERHTPAGNLVVAVALAGLRGQEANARLIAAAPDLLEALQAAVECGMVPTSSAAEGGASKHSRQVQVADMIRAAIARATHKEQT